MLLAESFPFLWASVSCIFKVRKLDKNCPKAFPSNKLLCHSIMAQSLQSEELIFSSQCDKNGFVFFRELWTHVYANRITVTSPLTHSAWNSKSYIPENWEGAWQEYHPIYQSREHHALFLFQSARQSPSFSAEWENSGWLIWTAWRPGWLPKHQGLSSHLRFSLLSLLRVLPLKCGRNPKGTVKLSRT